jgi:L-threonylcarbamoyladenylate synthase
MSTLVLHASKDEDIRAAALLLREGRLVAFPTETVYGLGARADDDIAVGELLRVKKRPPDKKLTILIAKPGDWALHAAPLGRSAAALAEVFWPGPLTLVVPDGSGG